MKQIILDKMFLMPKLFLSALMVLSLSVFSMFAAAAQPETGKSIRDFNHMNTGFPLTGMHTTVDCADCHVGGIFKGTPRNCAGCHAKGRRVVATTMSAKHLVTTEPCEVCHSNSVTFYGAKYNHGKAVIGQCATCHNGIVATGRAVEHMTHGGKRATESCDSCHRTYTWTPASWNHSGGGLCASCHNWTTGVNTPIKTNHTATTLSCGDCHVQVAWLPAAYRHSGNIASVCGTCHNGGTALGKTSNHIPTTGNNCDLCHTSTTSFATYTMSHSGLTSCKSCHGTGSAYPVLTKRTLGSHQGSTAAQDCNECHTTTTTWSGALGSMPSNHIPFNSGTSCNTCHIGSSVVTGAALHAHVSTACNTCHYKGGTVYLGNIQRSSHKGNTNCGNSGCHSSFTTWDR